MVLSGAVNKRLVRQLMGEGVSAVGISGEDGALLPAQLLDNGALGAVGEPLAANVVLIEAMLDAGFVPVISPLGRHVDTGEGLNINGDDAAAAIAGALRADELLLLADVPGVLDPAGMLVPTISIDAIDELVASGVARGGMSAKLQAARRALAAGVGAVRISDVNALVNPEVGTRLTNAHLPT
jgi:acetylglutamate kinase